MKKFYLLGAVLVLMVYILWPSAKVSIEQPANNMPAVLVAQTTAASNSTSAAESAGKQNPSPISEFRNRQEFEAAMKQSGAKRLAPGKATINISLKGGR